MKWRISDAHGGMVTTRRRGLRSSGSALANAKSPLAVQLDAVAAARRANVPLLLQRLAGEQLLLARERIISTVAPEVEHDLQRVGGRLGRACGTPRPPRSPGTCA